MEFKFKVGEEAKYRGETVEVGVPQKNFGTQEISYAIKGHGKISESELSKLRKTIPVRNQEVLDLRKEVSDLRKELAFSSKELNSKLSKDLNFKLDKIHKELDSKLDKGLKSSGKELKDKVDKVRKELKSELAKIEKTPNTKTKSNEYEAWETLKTLDWDKLVLLVGHEKLDIDVDDYENDEEGLRRAVAEECGFVIPK